MRATRLGWAVLAVLAAGRSVAYDVPIAANGKADAAIVLPADPSPTLQTAAQEIVAHVEKISGAKLDVAQETTAANRIVLKSDPSVIAQEDGFRIRTRPNEVAIVGGADMGALFGCYAFLEDLGVRWLVPGADGEVIPTKASLAYPETDRAETPSFRNRCFYVHNPDALQWAVRNRLNGFFPKDFAEAHGNLIYLPPVVQSIHSFAHILPAEKYFAAHPEYYALVKGKRVPATLLSGQICTSNPDVIRTIAEQVRKYFQDHPTARVFSIAPNDGYGWCECAECMAIDEKMCKNKVWYHSDQPVVSDRLCVFANEVARQAVHDMPGKELYMFAYVNYSDPPETARPDEHVTPVVCHYVPACYAHPIHTPDCPENVRFDDCLTGWARVSPQMMVYAYTDKSQWVDLPRPVVRQMAADIRYFRSLGVAKYLAQSGALSWDQMGPLYYVTAKLLWKPDADLEGVIAEWNRGMYGPAAAEMMAWYNSLESVVVNSKGHYGGDPLREAVHVYRPGCFKEAGEHLDRAFALAGSDAVRQRIEKVKTKFAFGVAGTEAICLRERWDETGDRAALAAAKAAAQTALSLRKSVGGISMKQFKEYLEGVVNEAGDGVSWAGWGEVETKGGKSCRNSDETGKGDNAAGWASFSTVLPDLTKTYVVTLEVWGESDFSGLLICSKGKGKGTGQGGVWKPLPREGEVTKKPEWLTIRFTVPPEMLDPETKRQRFGFGGADSQVWVASFKIEEKREDGQGRD